MCINFSCTSFLFEKEIYMDGELTFTADYLAYITGITLNATPLNNKFLLTKNPYIQVKM